MIEQKKNTFKKNERLCSRKQIELLFETGKSTSSYPIKAVFMRMDDSDLSTQSMFVVPKKNFKRSPDRNKLKRRMREAYRLNKNEYYGLLSEHGMKVYAAFIYTGKKIEPYSTVLLAVKKILKQLGTKS